ncbi:MAG: ImmA/IrrE family metallo-endopeptidase [Emergencia sp.]
MTYEDLLDEALVDGLVVKEKPLVAYDGLISGERIAIRKDMTTVKKTCVLAEELGHYHTTVGNILDQSNLENQRQEFRARVWAYEKILSIEKILDAAAHGYTAPHDMAEFLDVDEEFLKEYLAWQGILDISL